MKREIKVGLFVFLGLVVAGIIIFLVGDERRVFDKHFGYRATFEYVAGLKPGAPVRMGGIDVGTVTGVNLATDPADKRLHVTFNVVRSASRRIRRDSVVTITSKGLLGDKMLEISLGSEAQPAVPEGGEVATLPPEDPVKYLAKANDILDLTKNVLKNLETVSATATDPKVSEDLKASLSSARKILDDVNKTDGFAHRLLTDPKLADHLDQVFVEGARAGRSFDRVAQDIRVLLGQAKNGPGLLHTLLYSKEGERIVTSLSNASQEFADTMKEVRNGKGAAHELVYGESGATISKDLASIVKDAKDIVRDVKAGKGTVGALLVDPSIYEDVKTILGNLDRNQVLRAIVRYTIKQDENAPSPAVKAPPAGSASSTK